MRWIQIESDRRNLICIITENQLGGIKNHQIPRIQSICDIRSFVWFVMKNLRSSYRREKLPLFSQLNGIQQILNDQGYTDWQPHKAVWAKGLAKSYRPVIVGEWWMVEWSMNSPLTTPPFTFTNRSNEWEKNVRTPMNTTNPLFLTLIFSSVSVKNTGLFNVHAALRCCQ